MSGLNITDDRTNSSNTGATQAEFQRAIMDRLDTMSTQFQDFRRELTEVNVRLGRLENPSDTPSQEGDQREERPAVPLRPEPRVPLRPEPRHREVMLPQERQRRDAPRRGASPVHPPDPEYDRYPPQRYRYQAPPLDHRAYMPHHGRRDPERDDYLDPGRRDRGFRRGHRDLDHDDYFGPGRRERGPLPARRDYAIDDYEDEYPRPRRGGDRQDYDVTRRIRLDAPSYDGRLDPKDFSDWLLDMDHYFEWYDMADERRVRFAKMKLIGQAKVFWISVERDDERDGYYPITRWEDMKQRLKDKYLPHSYRDQLLDQLQSLKQGTLSVAEYMARFDELVVRSDISEEPIATASRFKAGLRSEIRRELIPHRLETVDQIFQLALEYEQYLRPSGTKQFSSRFESSTFKKSGPSQTTPATPSRVSTDTKGKATASDGQRSGGIVCYRCAGRGHVAAQCPTRTLLVEDEEHEVEDEEEHPEEIKATVEEGWESDAERALEMNVVRRFLHTPRVDEDWRRTTIFYTYFPSAGGPCKLAIDSGSCVNIVAQKGLDRMQVKAEPHPHPYRVVWVDKTAIQVTQRCLVPITIASFQDKVWCDVIPMDVAHVLLGRPWLFDRDVTCFGRSNTCVFYDKGQKITLTPTQPRDRPKGIVEPSASTSTLRPLHILRRSAFLRESIEADIIYVVAAIQAPEETPVDHPLAVRPLLDEFASIMPDELPDELPPQRDIQHAIDLIPGASLPNLPHYRMHPDEHAELKRQVDEHLRKQFIRERMSSCALCYERRASGSGLTRLTRPRLCKAKAGDVL